LINQISTTEAETVSVGNNRTEQGEWGEFLHLPGQRFHDIDQIRRVIKETNGITVYNEGILILPITLAIHSLNVPTLTLVNLPDLANVPIGDQPTVMEEEIRNMVRKEIAQPNTMILSIMAADGDWKDSVGLKLAREVDPNGHRTILALQNTDTMGDGVDHVGDMACEILSLGSESTPNIARNQWNIKSAQGVSFSSESEEQFDSHITYANQSSCGGTAYFARSLERILTLHIQDVLPDIKKDISLCMREHSAELKALGGNLIFSNSTEILLTSITEFCSEYRTILESKGPESSSDETPRYARLRSIMHEHYSNTVDAFDPSTYVKDADYRSLLYCHSGSCTEGFAGTSTFECVAKVLAKKLESPSINCVEIVHEELLRIVDKLLRKPAFQNYPGLREMFRNVLIAFLMNAKESTTTLVRDLVAMEACYINIRHPDLLSSHRAVAIVSERYSASNMVQLGTETKTSNLLSVSPVPSQPPTSSEEKRALEALVRPVIDSGIPRDKMETDVEVVKLLVASFFKITQRTMIDMVPKAIMLKLVRPTQDEMQRELLEHLYNSQQFENVRKESENCIRRHKDCQRMVECLTTAAEVCSQF
jgi:dynamin 1-like protein